MEEEGRKPHPLERFEMPPWMEVLVSIAILSIMSVVWILFMPKGYRPDEPPEPDVPGAIHTPILSRPTFGIKPKVPQGNFTAARFPRPSEDDAMLHIA
jgi:hypothetical protein